MPLFYSTTQLHFFMWSCIASSIISTARSTFHGWSTAITQTYSAQEVDEIGTLNWFPHNFISHPAASRLMRPRTPEVFDMRKWPWYFLDLSQALASLTHGSSTQLIHPISWSGLKGFLCIMAVEPRRGCNFSHDRAKSYHRRPTEPSRPTYCSNRFSNNSYALLKSSMEYLPGLFALINKWSSSITRRVHLDFWPMFSRRLVVPVPLLRR